MCAVPSLASGHLLLTIINDILDYSKIEAGQLSLHPASNNVCDVVEAAALLCYDMATSKNLSLSWFVDPALPAALMIDSTRMQQILLNLLSNGHPSHHAPAAVSTPRVLLLLLPCSCCHVCVCV